MEIIGKLLSRIFTYYDGYINRKMQKSLGFCGKNVIIKKGFVIDKPNYIFIDQNTHIGQYCHFRGGGKIVIGKWCQIASFCIITSAGHKIANGKYYDNVFYKDIEIGDNVWIGTNAIILPGIKIGDNSVIGAGSVVTKNVLSNTVVAGVPAKIIRSFNK
jgi:acetyltransferase-like isoleucine patch superfamily enzyme